MDFLADENFPLAATRLLRSLGHDVPAVVEDSSGAADEDVLERAVAERRVVLTFDSDYGRLIFESGFPAPPGIVYFRFNPTSPEEPAERLLELMDERDFAIPGNFTVIERDRLRQRPPPEPPPPSSS